MEKHAVARLIGAPPGYVGFEQGGLLVDAVRTHPYSVVLLDEIEKAHPDIFNILLQVMDHATLTDNNGRKADFRHVVLIMTSNAGSREMSAGSDRLRRRRRSARPRRPAARRRRRKSKAAIEQVFSPEFRNRLDAIVTLPAADAGRDGDDRRQVHLQLEEQLAERHVAITLTPEARAWLATKGYDPVFGARPLARVIQNEVRDPLTDEILFGALENGGTVTIGLADDELTFDVRGEAAGDARKPFRNGGARSRRVVARPSTAREPAGAERRSRAPASDRRCGVTAGREVPRCYVDEHDIPVKVVDRRWWARGEDGDAARTNESR